MKRIFSLAAILLVTVAFSGCGTDEAAQSSGGTPAPDDTTNLAIQPELDLNQVAFGIEGMT